MFRFGLHLAELRLSRSRRARVPTIACRFQCRRPYLQTRSMTVYTTQQSPSSASTPSSDSGNLLELLPEVSSLRHALAGLVASAYVDRLTGLLNGVALQRFEDVMERTHTFGAVFVDLTGFKSINDQYGHSAGDAALKQAGLALQDAASAYKAYVFRKSGDEFVLLTRKTSGARDCAAAVASRLAEGIPFSFENHEVAVRGAVGYSVREDSESTLSTLINQADAACRDAKDQGSAEPVQWTAAIAQDSTVSQRRRCHQCQATTSLLVREAQRRPSALQLCANCGASLEA